MVALDPGDPHCPTGGAQYLHTSAAGIDTSLVPGAAMHFISPSLLAPVTQGTTNVYGQHFAAGWASGDFNSNIGGNCAAIYLNVAQHYGACWVYNLGSSADSTGGVFEDGRVGPHVQNGVGAQLGLGMPFNTFVYSRVRRITRFVKW